MNKVGSVGSVEQILPQQRLKTSNVSYVSVICGMNGEGGKVCTKAKHSLSSIFRMINSLFSLRFYVMLIFSSNIVDKYRYVG